jgi:hypothetical protein
MRYRTDFQHLSAQKKIPVYQVSSPFVGKLATMGHEAFASCTNASKVRESKKKTS